MAKQGGGWLRREISGLLRREICGYSRETSGLEERWVATKRDEWLRKEMNC